MKNVKGKISKKISTNVSLAEDQEGYQTLHAHKTTTGQMVYAFDLSDEQVRKITESRRLILVQDTFGNPMQPIMPLLSRHELDNIIQ